MEDIVMAGTATTAVGDTIITEDGADTTTILEALVTTIITTITRIILEAVGEAVGAVAVGTPIMAGAAVWGSSACWD